MKRLVLGLLAAALTTAGCGWYTNIPAQIHVSSVKPGRLDYEPPDTRGIRLIKTETPMVRFQADPGSIGARFTKLNVTYRLIDSTVVSRAKLPPLQIGMSFRVESSNYPVQPRDARVPLEEQGRFIETGKTEIELPVVTRHVEQFGLELAQPEGNAALITADCTFEGTDDAEFPLSIQALVPIYFTGTPGSGN